MAYAAVELYVVLFFLNIRKGEWLAAGTYRFTPWYPLLRVWVSQNRSAFSDEGKNLCPIPDSNPESLIFQLVT